jgi:drug/metabolite transporter (DMT)-like permease
VFFASNFICAKFLYTNHPELTASQLLVYRSIFSSALVFAMMNVHIKEQMWDSLKGREEKIGLITRTIQGNISVTVNYITVKYFSLSTVAIIMNMAPFFSLPMAYFFLGERMTWY